MLTFLHVDPPVAIVVPGFNDVFCYLIKTGSMSQKPIVMEQLKQILQLKCDGIGIREIARRTGISRNSVRKYLAMLPAATSDEDSPELSNRDLADRAYNNDQLEHDAVRLQQLSQHFFSCESGLSNMMI